MGKLSKKQWKNNPENKKFIQKNDKIIRNNGKNFPQNLETFPKNGKNLRKSGQTFAPEERKVVKSIVEQERPGNESNRIPEIAGIFRTKFIRKISKIAASAGIFRTKFIRKISKITARPLEVHETLI
jgi:hypothetical protein